MPVESRAAGMGGVLQRGAPASVAWLAVADGVSCETALGGCFLTPAVSYAPNEYRELTQAHECGIQYSAMALPGRIRRLLKADPDLTVEQIAGALGVGAGKVERAMPALKKPVQRNVGGASASTPTPPTPTPSEEPIELKVGDRVATSARQAGVIVSSRPIDGGGFEYLVFWGPGDESWYSGTQLIPIRAHQKRQIVGPEDLIKNLALLKMRRRFNDVLYSYQASRTVMQPHQFRPAVKFLENPSHRLLIADRKDRPIWAAERQSPHLFALISRHH